MGKLSVYDKCKPREEKDRGYFQVTYDVNNYPPEKLKDVSPKIDVEDHNMIMMQLDNGVQASYMQCHYTPDSVRNYTFIGTKGRLENLGDHGDCEIHVYNTRFDGFGKPDIIYKLRAVEGTHGGSDPAIVKAFIRYIRDGEKPNTSPIAAREAVATGVMATESLRNGSNLKVVPKLDQEIVDYFTNN
jgi:predicted dehydrogenase